MKNFALLSILGACALAGCTPLVIEGETAATIYATRPGTPPPADTRHQIQDHETWCYKTMANAECYSKAQDVQPNRLINVEPENLRPLTADAYKDELAGRRPSPATARPASLDASNDAAEEDIADEKLSYIERMTGLKFPF